MGVMVYSVLCVMQALYHQPYHLEPYSAKPGGRKRVLLQDSEALLVVSELLGRRSCKVSL